MAHTLTVVFSGVVAFVPNDEGGTRYRVLLPDTIMGRHGPRGEFGKKNGKKALDNKPLRRHHPYLRWNRNIWLLEDERVRFHLPGAPSMVGPMPPEVIPMADVMPEPKIDPNAIANPGGSGSRLVTVYTDIDRGSFSCRGSSRWTIPGTLNGGKTTDFAREVHLTVEGLQSDVQVIASRFDGKGSRSLSIPTGSEDVVVDIKNLEAQDVVEHLHRRVAPRKPDEDFRWYFELLSEGRKQWVRRLLAATNADLPIPMPIPDGGPDMAPPFGGCMTAVFPAHDWAVEAE